MLKRDDWLDLARKLDWNYKYVSEEDVFPAVASGTPWLPHEQWASWDEPFKTSYAEYVHNQHAKDDSVYAVRDAVGRLKDFEKLPSQWSNALKLHAAALPLAEFAATVGNLRAARFGRDSAWRTMSAFGAMDEYRHTQIPLLIMHELIRLDPQFDWTHRFYHTNNWVAIAARHVFDELLLAANPIEFAVGTNFVFETGFTNLQFIGLAALADQVGDHMFEKMLTSIQTDEARHAQIGPAVLRTLVEHDRDYAQYLLDKWFWRSWLLFAVVTGFSMDYLMPLEKRTTSFKEFMQEWIIDQYLESLQQYGLKKPWYWETFIESLSIYHHMVYASAYTYRPTVWFNFVVPGVDERKWLREKYPEHWDELDAVWQQISAQWEGAPGEQEKAIGSAMVSFCDLCQLVLCGGTPSHNTAETVEFNGESYIFCSEPCRWIFQQEPQRYAAHKGLVKRILCGAAPGALPQLLTEYFQLTPDTWGKDVTARGGRHD
ncbi:MAG TPA: YHS domain-containing protein [Candidatus Obscuribacterales bacterium]